jgi:hypothetical protein
VSRRVEVVVDGNFDAIREGSRAWKLIATLS